MSNESASIQAYVITRMVVKNGILHRRASLPTFYSSVGEAREAVPGIESTLPSDNTLVIEIVEIPVRKTDLVRWINATVALAKATVQGPTKAEHSDGMSTTDTSKSDVA